MPANLFRKHFQIAYVTRDAHAAMKQFGARYGVEKWHVMDMFQLQGEESIVRYIATAYAGDVMIEFMEPAPGRPSLYADWLSPGQDIKLHHLGFYVHSDEELREARALLDADGIDVVYEGRFGDVLEFLYADTVKQLGHYYEIIHLLPAGLNFFEQTPHND